MEPVYVIGIDGGGTKTTAVLCTLKGIIAATANGGPTNVNVVGVDQTAHTLAHLINQCCLTVRCSISEIGAIVAGIAGAGDPTLQERIVNDVNGFFGEHIPLFIENDARIALESAFKSSNGILIAVGTGSVFYGKVKNNIVCVGGWGKLLGDEGSGWWLGREVLRAVLAEYDGIGEQTLCTTLIATQHNASSRNAIIDLVYRHSFDIASLAPLVLQAATQKDPIALSILNRGCHALVHTLRLTLKLLQWKSKEKLPCVLIGSLVAKKNIYSQLLRSEIQKSFPYLTIIKPKHSPAVGAARLAIDIVKGRSTLFH
ncbi:MAG: hypothetical protein N3A63_09175 [Bacteroidetes bacterium]|nr:hypothetical protein [Bacteroidota bacterium]